MPAISSTKAQRSAQNTSTTIQTYKGTINIRLLRRRTRLIPTIKPHLPLRLTSPTLSLQSKVITRHDVHRNARVAKVRLRFRGDGIYGDRVPIYEAVFIHSYAHRVGEKMYRLEHYPREYDFDDD